MKNSNQASKFLKGFLIATAVIFFLFVVSFLVYAINEGFLETLKFHAQGMLDLFTFNFNPGNNAIYLALSPFFYALAISWLVFLIDGAVINSKKNRRWMWWPIAATFLNVGVYLVLASGAQKFWQTVRAMDTNVKFFATACLVSTGLTYFVLSIAFYLKSMADICMEPSEEQEPQVVQTVSDDHIREIVQQELAKLQQPLPIKLLSPQRRTVVIRKKKDSDDAKNGGNEPEVEVTIKEANNDEK